ncbi:MAG: InlB B-repeat-containing protein [Firmicutes bacterium]|nr:InlB B-repeat-containing protein [Bacillota bacterium]
MKRISLAVSIVLLMFFALSACSGGASFVADTLLSGVADSLNLSQNDITSGENGVKSPSNAPSLPKNNDEDEEPIVEFTAFFITFGGTNIEPIICAVLEEYMIPLPTRFGFVFEGWFLEENFSGTVVFNADNTKFYMQDNTTFYAKWGLDIVQEIRTVAQLKNIANPNNVSSMAQRYRLMANIDLRGEAWEPLGQSISRSEEREGKVKQNRSALPFTGSLDGNGFSIIGLSLMPLGPEERFNHLYYGLFAIIGAGAVVQNLHFSSVRIELDGGYSNFYIGALAGRLDRGTVRNCTATGVRINNPELKYEAGLLDDFFFSSATPTSSAFIGGLIGGITEGTVENCAVLSGSVISKSVADGVFVGGLAGFNWRGIIRRSTSAVAVEGRYAGGLAGYNNGRIYDSDSSGSVLGSIAYPAVAGGLTAYNDIDGEILRSFARGSVRARTAGGLVGINMYNFSLNAPPSTGGDPIVRALGLDNESLGNGTGGIISNSYASGNVTASEYAGGLIGRAEAKVPVNGAWAKIPELDADGNFAKDEDGNVIYVTDEDGKLIYEYQLKEERYFIINCFAFGNVVAYAEEIMFKNSLGNWVLSVGVHHTVFAGGLIGHAVEPAITGSGAFGNVLAESKRPVASGDSFVFNTAFASNTIGRSSSVLTYSRPASDYYFMPIRMLVGSAEQTVLRNGIPFEGFNGFNLSPSLLASAFTSAFFTGSPTASTPGMGFSSAVWDFSNTDIENKIYPRLIRN